MIKYISTNKKGTRMFNPSLLAEDLGMRPGDKREFRFRNITYKHGRMLTPTGLWVEEENEVRGLEIAEGKSGKTRFKVYIANIYGNKKNNATYVMEWFDDETIEKILAQVFAQN